MKTHRSIGLLATHAVALVVLATASAGYAVPAEQAQRPPIVVAQAPANQPRELEPRYQPVPPEQKGWYNGSYIFGITRTVAASTMVPAVKVLLFPLTVPLDIVFLPFAAIGGCFG
ncbi:MAG TPA: hypothetical protein VMT89_03085 [Candidatus Acidoferrales bacterium]|nr:hypothetical protein [Candidatus Acidoferrales bacterium]